MTLGFQLLGSCATTCPQFEQIEQEKVAAMNALENKAEELRLKVEKAGALFQLLKLGKNIKRGVEQYHNIFTSTLQHGNGNTIHIKFRKKMLQNSTRLNLYGNKWDVLMQNCLKVYQRNTSPGKLISVNQPTNQIARTITS